MDGFYKTVLQLDVNIIAIVVLLIIYVTAFKRLDTTNNINNSFVNISVLIIIILFIETLKVLIDGQPYSWLIPIAKTLNFILFVLGPYITYLWTTLTIRWVNVKKIRKLKFNIPLFALIVLNTILAIISLFNGIIFSVNEYNFFVKGPLYYVPLSITSFNLWLSLVIISFNRTKIEKDDYVAMMIFGSIPAIGGLIQMFFPGLRSIWSCTAFSLVILYIHIQQRLIQVDTLTGAWTRSTFEQYLENRIKYLEDGRFGLIFMDLDGFKRINDAFGHIEGDAALKKVVEIIKASIKKCDAVSRFGGDEFVILVNVDSYVELQDTVKRLHDNFARYNKTTQKPYKIEYSVGYEIYKSRNQKISKFINHVDHLMYINKEQKRKMDMYKVTPDSW